MVLSDTKPKLDIAKEQIIDLLRRYIDNAEEEILTGISDGIYSKKDNKENLAAFKEQRKFISYFEQWVPSIYVYVEGGNIQGASATANINFNLYDIDNLHGCDEQEQKEFYKNFGTPEQWDAMIKRRTETGELVPVY